MASVVVVFQAFNQRLVCSELFVPVDGRDYFEPLGIGLLAMLIKELLAHHLGDVGCRYGYITIASSGGDRFAVRRGEFGLADHALVQHVCESDAATLDCSRRITQRVAG